MCVCDSAGGTQRISRIVGISQAKMLIYTGKELNAEDARQIGIIRKNKILIFQKGLVDFVAKESAYADALDLARKILPQGMLN